MKILIVDDEIEICEIIEFFVQDHFPNGTITITANSGNAAIKILTDNADIDVCICDHNMPNGMGTDVIKFLMESKSQTKFVLCSTVVPGDKPTNYPSSGVFSNIQKPDISGGVENLYQFLCVSTPEKTVGEVDEYTPVSIHLLSLMGKVPADIYIRVSENKYLKCINQFEEFGSGDVEKYKQKQIQVLYSKKGEQIPIVKEVLLAAVNSIMSRANLPLTDKMSIAHSHLVGLIKFTGISSELAEISKNNVQQSITLLMKSPMTMDFWKVLNLLGEYPSRLYTLHSMLASVVVKKLSWHSEATLFKLTLAAFLQDVSLDSIPLMEICDYREFLEKEESFSRADVKKFNEHPVRATELLASFKEIPPDIDRLLMEQHEMPDGTGFPRKLSANQIGPMSAVFIITGIFAKQVLKEGHLFDVGAFASFLEARGYSRGNFKDAFEVIRAMKNG